MSAGTEDIYGDHGLPICALRMIEISTGVALAITIWIAFNAIKTNDPAAKNALQWAAAFWIVVPPMWFMFEYFSLFKSYGCEKLFETFKYGQDVASKAWIAIAGALAIWAKK